MKFSINPTLPPFYERENKTPPYISYVLHELYPYNIITLHCHKHAEIGICLEGSGYNYIENRIYRFQTGDLQYVSAYTPHLATSDQGVISKWIWISVDILNLLSSYLKAEEMPTIHSMLENSFNGTFHPEEHEKLSKLIYDLYNLLKKPDRLSSLRELFLVGELLLEAHSIGDIDSEKVPTYKKSLSLYPIILYIRKNYWNSTAMKEENLAQLSKYSVSHFRYLFKKETGLSVRDFILQTRLSYAAYSLKSSNEPVLNIALDTGFGNVSHFNRTFAKYYHCSPSVYRKENK